MSKDLSMMYFKYILDNLFTYDIDDSLESEYLSFDVFCELYKDCL